MTTCKAVQVYARGLSAFRTIVLEILSFSDKWSPQQTTNDRVGMSVDTTRHSYGGGNDGSPPSYVTEKLGASAVGSWIQR